MPGLDAIHETYRARLEDEACYTQVSEPTQQNLDMDVRRYGLHGIEKVAHGVLAFCVSEGSPVCLPWLVAPDAPGHDIIGGRHGLVTQEFYPIAEQEGLTSYKFGARRGLDYDDFIGTYVIRDASNETPFTVICDSADAKDATPEHVELIKDLSLLLEDHQIVIGAGGDITKRVFTKIKDGLAEEVTFGMQRGLKLETIAATNDIVGKARELENYASHAQKHGLDQWEFTLLASKAVEAFHAGRQVSLDDLCGEVIAERGQDDLWFEEGPNPTA